MRLGGALRRSGEAAPGVESCGNRGQFPSAPSPEFILLDADRYLAVIDPHNMPQRYEFQRAGAAQQGRPIDRKLHAISGSRKLRSPEQNASTAEIDG